MSPRFRPRQRGRLSSTTVYRRPNALWLLREGDRGAHDTVPLLRRLIRNNVWTKCCNRCHLSKRSGRRRRDVKTLVSIFNLISLGFVIFTGGREAHPVSPRRIWHASGRFGFFKHMLSRKGVSGLVSLVCFSHDPIPNLSPKTLCYDTRRPPPFRHV